MIGNYILPLNDPRASLALVGGKGASLARLAAAGLPVPGGFHVTTGAYQRFVADNHLQPDIESALATVNPAQPATLDAAAGAIQALFQQGAIPADVAEAIVCAYAALGDQVTVAVRSSATAEDLPDLSFAGQQATLLNQRGSPAVLAAVRACWASLWSARAIGYRAQHGVDSGGLSLAVVVQLLVGAEAAGVLFTADPLTGRRDQAIVTAAWGLGEAIVGGLVTPDTLVMDKNTGRILSRTTADKQVMTVRVDGGAEEQPTPEPLRQAPVLGDEAAAELVRLGLQIEQLYGQPMDIEWARAGGAFAILQARPITALPTPGAVVLDEWKLPSKSTFMRGSIVDFLPDPLSPLFATFGSAHYTAGFRRLLKQLTGDDRAQLFSLVAINGYGYLSVDMNLSTWARIMLLMTNMPQLLRSAQPRWRAEAARYAETVARWHAKPLAGLSATDLFDGAGEVFDAAVDHLVTLQAGIMGMAGGAEALFQGVYDRLIRKPGDPDAAAFVLGYDSTPILADKALYDLALWCRAQPGLAPYLQAVPATRLVAELNSPTAPPSLDPGAWSELRGRWQAHLDHYGAMIYSLDFARPLPCDEPAPLLEALKLYLGGQAPNPYARQQKLAERREAVSQAMLARPAGWRQKVFRTVLRWAQAVAPLREDGIANLGLGYPQLRRLLAELGRRLAQAGALQRPADIFWLTEGEVRAAAAELDQCQPVTPRLEFVRQREAEWQAQKRLTPPPILPPRKKFLGLNVEQWFPVSGEAQVGDTLKGVAASPGQVTAAACVLHGPADFDQMHPGCVLVAEITTPAWTPLFAMAAAVVTDIGGPLSHGSIVAREYGIPAVMGTGVATRRIHTGQVVTVDGSAGLITLCRN